MIRFLVISLLACSILVSCSLKTTEGLRQVHFNKSDVENPYFSNSEIDYVYKAKIAVYGKNFGGILIIKKTGPESHRVVFTTEFGSKLFDFQFEGNTFTKNFVVEDLDKKFIINILKDDFMLLVNESATVLAVYQSNNERVYKTQSDERFNFYFLEDTSEKLEKIVNTSKTKEKVEIDFTSSEENIAETIAIKHNNIKLEIDLKKFKE
ncbi:hypothetical protein [Aequorivita antarctica]|uniref:DUF4292 domain-containing protein n=1 Tax=Aequorivita antarctica TaxID=153266 RepID=A0A5C6Z690_9FLAO|nr:hypothetical protein [Aequorivita antarctica]TXD75041.1 hypothetical protein ESU54_02275 [Aequorivita antarctica]SRX72229.1 hypothetical protein AEQU3_00060 [Aequorivita antarctica]